MNSGETLKSDMAKFCEIFGHNYKVIKPGRLLFRVRDVDSQIAEARSIISRNKLKVILVNNADLASYRAFEVWEGAE